MKEETLINGNRKLVISLDNCPENPREWDNLGTMACFHGRYTLGDKHELSIEEAKAIEANNSDKFIVLPLYLYDHSGITMATTPFSCPWDSGQVGIIFVSKEKIRKEYGWKLITKTRKEKILGYLRGEVQTYDRYLRGEVYGFELYDNDVEIDSCGGFYGSDHEKSGLFDHAGWMV